MFAPRAALRTASCLSRQLRPLHTTIAVQAPRKPDLAGLVPTTPAEQADYTSRESGGFSAAHGVGDEIRPVAYDPLPPVNARGGRDVNGWRALYQGVVAPHWTNLHKTLHGGCSAWIVDNLTGRVVELLATDTWWGPGVSMTLDMTYQAPARPGTKLDILVTVDRMTGSVAYTRCEIFVHDSGERIASGTHVLMWKAPKKK